MKVMPFPFLSALEEACLLRFLLLGEFGSHDPRRLFDAGLLTELDDRKPVLTPKGAAYAEAWLEVDVPQPTVDDLQPSIPCPVHGRCEGLPI